MIISITFSWFNGTSKMLALAGKMLKSEEGRKALEALDNAKKKLLFKNYDELMGITDINITEFINTNFDKIFE